MAPQRLWGSEWRYVHGRRTPIFVERSNDEGTPWAVFEPNDGGAWAKVRHTMTDFLKTRCPNGLLEGVTGAEAYFGVRDRGTMTQDDVDHGRPICEVGIAAMYPPEVVSKWVGETEKSMGGLLCRA